MLLAGTATGLGHGAWGRPGEAKEALLLRWVITGASLCFTPVTSSVPQLQPASWRSPCRRRSKWRVGAQPGSSAVSTSLKMVPTTTSTGST